MSLAELVAELNVGEAPLSALAVEMGVGWAGDGPSTDQQAQYNVLRENWTGFLGKGGTSKYPFAADDFKTFQNFVGQWTAESIDDAMLGTLLGIEQSRWNRVRDLMIEQDVKASSAGKPAPAPTGATLKQGDKGEAVKAWQSQIGATPDGIFGPQTAAMTKSIQAQAGLPQTGVVDAATRAAASTYKASKPAGGGGGYGAPKSPPTPTAQPAPPPVASYEPPAIDLARLGVALGTGLLAATAATAAYAFAKSRKWI